MIIEQQSEAFDIRNAFYDLVTADVFFDGYTKRKTKMLPVQQGLLPYLGIYLVDEIMGPDGDANAGMVRFSHTARIGFSVIAVNNDQVVLEQTIDQAFKKIMSILWTDLHLMNVLQKLLGDNANPENVIIESINRGTRRFTFGPASFNNEMPLGELQYEVSAFYRTEWWPDITDTLDEIDVTTGVKAGDTPEEMAQREQVEAHYVFTSTPLRRKPPQPWRFKRDQRGAGIN